jgi:tRNA U34 2-thiouridine synthase MnmA/TrmU
MLCGEHREIRGFRQLHILIPPPRQAMESMESHKACFPPFPHSLEVTAKIRHRREPAPAVLENAPNGEVRVTFDEAQRAITPGQAVVFYDGDLVIGGGWIAETATR